MISALKELWEYVFGVVRSIMKGCTVGVASKFIKHEPMTCWGDSDVINQPRIPYHDILGGQNAKNEPRAVHQGCFEIPPLNSSGRHIIGGEAGKLDRVLSDFTVGVILGGPHSEFEDFNGVSDIESRFEDVCKHEVESCFEEVCKKMDATINYENLSNRISKVVTALIRTVEQIKQSSGIANSNESPPGLTESKITHASESLANSESKSFPKVTIGYKPSLDGVSKSLQAATGSGEPKSAESAESAEPSCDDDRYLNENKGSLPSSGTKSEPIDDTQSSIISFKEAGDRCMPHKVAAELGFRESGEDWDVKWTTDFLSVRACRGMKSHQRINHFPGSICLSHKDLLGWNLNRMRAIFPKEYDIFPKTWLLPSDTAKVERYAMKNPRSSFIVKPHAGGSGTGIKIMTEALGIYRCGKSVCQLYIQRPLLIDGYKFDFRVYVLITSIAPLRIFVHNEGLARFSTMKYEQPSFRNFGEKFMHLTNTSVNKDSPSYMKEESKGSTRRISKVFQWLTDQNMDVSEVQKSMDDAIIKTLIVSLPTLKHCYYLGFPTHSDSISCFELMGFDIILDRKLKVYVLEVNIAPSFANEAGTAHVDSIKKEVVTDTFKILNLMENERKTKDKNCTDSGNDGANKEKIKAEDKMITRRRTEWENSHLGNFRKVYPTKTARASEYKKFISIAKSKLKTIFHSNGELELTRQQKKWFS